MSKLDNHVFLIICEISYEQFKNTKFQNYINHCNLLKTALASQEIGNNQKKQISSLVNILMNVLGFDINTASEYVALFYYEDKFHVFESIVINQIETQSNFKWLDILK
jgi:hypothetical protein